MKDKNILYAKDFLYAIKVEYNTTEQFSPEAFVPTKVTKEIECYTLYELLVVLKKLKKELKTIADPILIIDTIHGDDIVETNTDLNKIFIE